LLELLDGEWKSMRLVTTVVLDENERREIARVHRWIDIHPDAGRWRVVARSANCSARPSTG